MIDILYAALRGRIKDEVAAVKWIDLDSGQLDNPERNYPPIFPAVYIDFPEIPWEDRGELRQDGLAQINVRVAMRIYNQTHGNTQDDEYDTFTRAMTGLQLISSVHAKLHGYSDGINFGRLSRLSTNAEKRDDGLKVFNMIYVCRVMDLSAKKTYTTVPDGAALSVRKDINRSHLKLAGIASDYDPEVDTEVTLTYAVYNAGSESGSGAQVQINLPASATHVSNDGSCTLVDNKLTWLPGTVTAGQTKTLHVVVEFSEAVGVEVVANLSYNEQADPPSHASVTFELDPFLPPN